MLVARLSIVITLILAANVWAVSAAPTAAARVSGEAYGASTGIPFSPVAGSPYVALPPEGGSLADSAPGVNIGIGGLVGNADQVNSTTSGSLIGDGGSVTSTTTIKFAELFAGIVRANDIRVVATSTQDGGRAFSSANVQFGSLIIAGLSYGNPRPNERVDLPGVGYVVLNEQITGGDGRTSSSMVARAIRLVVTAAGVLDVPPGAEIVVGSASSGVPDISNYAPVASGPPPTPTRVEYRPLGALPPLDLSSDNDRDDEDDDDDDFNFNENANDNGGGAAPAATARPSGTSGPLVVTVVVVLVTPTATATSTKTP